MPICDRSDAFRPDQPQSCDPVLDRGGITHP
jgi:hypothetical protein